MVCMTSCVIAIAMISASLFVFLNTEKDEKIQRLIKELSPAQRVIYKKISEERRNLYCQGLFSK